MLRKGTYQAGLFAGIPVYTTVYYKMLENTLMDLCYKKSAPNSQIWGFCEITFKRSNNELLDYSDMTKVIAARLLPNFTFFAL